MTSTVPSPTARTEPSRVAASPPADPTIAVAHFTGLLSLETDCWDVHDALASGRLDFVLLHVSGTPESYAAEHVPGAIYLHHSDIGAETVARWPDDTLFVVYCAGPHCNAADRAAVALARLGRRVKKMIGGRLGWAAEGFAFASS